MLLDDFVNSEEVLDLVKNIIGIGRRIYIIIVIIVNFFIVWVYGIKS